MKTRREFLRTVAAGGAAAILARSRASAADPDSSIVVHSGYGREFTMAELRVELVDEVKVGDRVFPPSHPPSGLRIEPSLGLVVHEALAVQRLHAEPPPGNFDEAPRVVRTADGDYLVIFCSGSGHMINHLSKVNELLAYRSSDRGRTWSGPTSPWWVPYNQHAWNPLQPPRLGRRLVGFGTEPRLDLFHPPHDGGIALRFSDDGGHTWTKPRILAPENDPGYRGVGHMRGCVTQSGTWLIPTYDVRAGPGGWPHREDTQYVLHSADDGASWNLRPGPRPGGWAIKPYHRMLEGQILSLGGEKAVMFSRVPSGRIWELRTSDGGLSWTEPKPTALVHPDAPPMVFKLSDGKTLLALIHNQPPRRRLDYFAADRRELWACLSRDDGRTWSEPRFLLGDACKGLPPSGWTEVSYCDLLADDGELHLFFDHQKRQIMYARFAEADLERLPTRHQL